jgi:hypothetical protein
VLATASLATKVFVVTFDRPLTPGVGDLFNWSATASLGAGLQAWVPQPASPPTALGLTVTWTGRVLGIPVPPPTISYDPPPFDIIGANGAPVALFHSFPLAIIP